MSILALDTATLASSVAIVDRERLVAEITLETKLTHSEVLMPHISRLMAMAGLRRAELEAVAISIGPGSFTGLRIGLATAKSLAYALSIPIIGVSTLEALACHYRAPEIAVMPLMDAQKGNVYAAIYEWRGAALYEVAKPFVGAFDDVLAQARLIDRPVMILGEMAAKKRDAIIAAGGNVQLAAAHTMMPRAANVGVRAFELWDKGAIGDVMTLEPLYVRRSEAEELWERRHGGNICRT